MKFLRSLLVLSSLAASAPALAQNPFAYMNPQQLQIPATGADFNRLIQTLDTYFGPIFPLAPSGATATSGISLTPGTANVTPTIQTYSFDGSQTNIGLRINPLGNGNIILFSGSTSPLETGLIQVANSASWVPIQGIAACPGVAANKAPLGMADHVTGYFMILDWASRSHGIATC